MHPIAAAQHHREERGLDHYRTPQSEELSEEAERLNDRWWDLEQESRSDTHNLAASRHTISSERAAFQDKISQCREKYRKRRLDIYGGSLSRYV